VGRHFTSSYFFFYTSKLFLKNYTSISWWYVPMEKKSEFLEHFWAFRFQHSHFNVCTKYYIIEHLSSISSMVAFFQNLCDSIDLFFVGKLHKSSFISTMAIIKIIPHKWEIMLITTKLVKKTRKMLKHSWSFRD